MDDSESVEGHGGWAEGVDENVPSVARMYDWALGGAHNFAADRARVAEVTAVEPNGIALAWANRRFLQHAVEHMLARGIVQFLDLGSGIPTVGNVHEIALRDDPAARVAYVDVESVAVAHSAAVLASVPRATITHADLRDTETVLAAPGVAGHLDLERPVGLLVVAVLHFVSDVDDPAGILARYRAALAPGSMLALSHTSDDYPEYPDLAARRREVRREYATTSHAMHDRTRREIRAIVEGGGFVIDADGPVDLTRWAGTPTSDGPVGGYGVITEPLVPGPGRERR